MKLREVKLCVSTVGDGTSNLRLVHGLGQQYERDFKIYIKETKNGKLKLKLMEVEPGE